MSEKLTVVGALAGIEEKTSGWFTIKVAMPGKEWPLKLDTKIERLIQEARETKGEFATWTYTETESGQINPNNNKPYMNRRLEGVELGGAEASTASGNGQPAEKVDWDAKERRDFMSRAWAQTLSTFEHTIKADEDPEAVFRRLKPFQRLVYTDICGEFAFTQEEKEASPF